MDRAVLSSKSNNLHKHQNRGRRLMTPTSSLLTSFTHIPATRSLTRVDDWYVRMWSWTFEFCKFSGAVGFGYIGQYSGSSANGMDQINCSSASGTDIHAPLLWSSSNLWTSSDLLVSVPSAFLSSKVNLLKLNKRCLICQCFGQCD